MKISPMKQYKNKFWKSICKIRKTPTSNHSTGLESKIDFKYCSLNKSYIDQIWHFIIDSIINWFLKVAVLTQYLFHSVKRLPMISELDILPSKLVRFPHLLGCLLSGCFWPHSTSLIKWLENLTLRQLVYLQSLQSISQWSYAA